MKNIMKKSLSLILLTTVITFTHTINAAGPLRRALPIAASAAAAYGQRLAHTTTRQQAPFRMTTLTIPLIAITVSTAWYGPEQEQQYWNKQLWQTAMIDINDVAGIVAMLKDMPHDEYRKAAVNSFGKRCDTLLSHAIFHQQADLVTVLLDAGADVDSIDPGIGCSLFHFALLQALADPSEKRVNIVKLLKTKAPTITRYDRILEAELKKKTNGFGG